MSGRSFVAPIAAAALGAVLFGIADATIGLLEQGLAVAGLAQHAIYFLLVVGHALLAGLAAGAAAGLVLGLFARPRLLDARGNGFSLGLLLLALAAAALCEWLNLELFKGSGVRGRAWRPALEWTFRILGAPLVVVAVLGAGRALRGPRPREAGVAFVLFGLLLLVANRFYRQQYPAIHLQLAVAALVAMAAGAWGVLRRSRLHPARSVAGALATLVSALVVALAAVHVGRIPALAPATARAEAAYATRAFAVAQLEPLTRRVAAIAGRRSSAPFGSVEVGELIRQVAPQLAGPDDEARAQRVSSQATLDRTLPGRRSWNVLWIALDTVRADHVGHLGYPRKTTPVLDALARDAFVFEHAHTAYPTSNYGFCSALTSLAARANPVYGRRFHESFRYHELQALPSLLARHGRATAAVTAFNRADVDDPVFFKQLKEGFEVFNPDQDAAAAAAPEITRSALDVLRGRLADPRRPFFFWVHYIDPHDPYTRHPEFDFGPESIDRYDSEIAYTDSHAGQVLAALEKSGRMNDTVIVVFSDHGEEFNEHGGRYHNGSVYAEQIHVPLLIRVPGMAGRNVTSAVSLLDLVPTIADLLGIEDPAPRHGRSLVPLLLGQDDLGVAYSEVFVAGHEERAKNVRTVVVGRNKLIHRVEEERFEMFDLGRDPRERESLAGRGDPAEGRLRAVLARWDQTIDGFFSPESAPSSAARIDAHIEELTDPSVGVALAAVSKLEGMLLDGYGVEPRVASELQPAEIEGVFDTLASLEPRMSLGVADVVVPMLAERANPDYIPVFRRMLGDPARLPVTRMRAALALAMLDQPDGLPLLRQAAAAPAMPDKGDLAWALVRLGDASLLDWYLADLNGRRWGRTVRQAIAALPMFEKLLARNPDLPKVPASRALRDRVFEEQSRHAELSLAMVSVLRGRKDEDSLLILLRLLRNEDDEVRKAARAALEGVLSPADLERGRVAMDDEIDADSAALNLDWDLAEAGYRTALAKGALKNVGARFRLASVLHGAGRTATARDELEQIELVATTGYDRDLARRRINQLRWPLFGDPSRWSCEVLEARLAGHPLPSMPFGVRFKLRNDGSEPWRGGWGAGSVELRLRFVDGNGSIVERIPDQAFLNHLDEGGVNPGEEVEVLVVGAGPEGSEQGPIALSFANRRAQYPKAGIVWTRSLPGSAPSSGPSPR